MPGIAHIVMQVTVACLECVALPSGTMRRAAIAPLEMNRACIWGVPPAGGHAGSVVVSLHICLYLDQLLQSAPISKQQLYIQMCICIAATRKFQAMMPAAGMEI